MGMFEIIVKKIICLILFLLSVNCLAFVCPNLDTFQKNKQGLWVPVKPFPQLPANMSWESAWHDGSEKDYYLLTVMQVVIPADTADGVTCMYGPYPGFPDLIGLRIKLTPGHYITPAPGSKFSLPVKPDKSSVWDYKCNDLDAENCAFTISNKVPPISQPNDKGNRKKKNNNITLFNINITTSNGKSFDADLVLKKYVGSSVTAPCSDLQLLSGEDGTDIIIKPRQVAVTSADLENYLGLGYTCQRVDYTVNGKEYTSGNIVFTWDAANEIYIDASPKQIKIIFEVPAK